MTLDKSSENDFVSMEGNLKFIIKKDLMEKAGMITVNHSSVEGFTVLSDNPLIGICSFAN
ncbi:MAG: hypothetical protein KJ647_08295 [Candidatus Omnitrophica bacterium]|nr:hypothetical protein [Candidatus Omnitrophota bacterium]